jgi:ABC-type uncharacterized transport system substrate-binding protein
MSILRSRIQACVGIIALQILVSAPALAGPQIWVAVRSEITFDQERRAVAIRQVWEFDEFYSAAIAGPETGIDASVRRLWNLSTPSEALNALARRGFYTSARLGDRMLAFKSPQDVRIEADNKNRVRLHFTLPFEGPFFLDKPLVLDVRDPDRRVAFGLEIANPVTMSGNHGGCSVKIIEPEAFVTAYGEQPPTSAKIACE